jgi:tetratricopeptide (TPR) repeat protein
MHKIKLYSGILLISFILLSGCAGMDGSEIKGQKAGMDKDDAIPVYEGYIGENPDSVKSRGRLGVWYLKTGRLNEAIAEFETTLKNEPGEPFSTYYLGLAYLNKENFEKAIQIWEGYKNINKPLIEEEIGRQLTLLRIAHSRKFAAKALAEEKKIMTVKPDADTVAVCYYQDLSSDKSLRAFQKGLTAMMISDLTKIKSIKVVERVRLQALLEEMNLGQTGIVDPNTAPRVGKLLSARNVIFGNLALGSIKATTTLASADQGTVKGSVTASVDKDRFFELPAFIVRDIAGIMKIELTDEERKAIGVPHTKVYKALVYFGNALDALDAGKWKEANDYFGMALKEDPMFDLARNAAGMCPGADSPDISAVLNMSSSKLSSRIETSVNSAVGIRTGIDQPVMELPTGVGYTGTDILGVDVGAIGVNEVSSGTVVPDSEQQYTPGGPPYP